MSQSDPSPAANGAAARVVTSGAALPPGLRGAASDRGAAAAAAAEETGAAGGAGGRRAFRGRPAAVSLQPSGADPPWTESCWRVTWAVAEVAKR